MSRTTPAGVPSGPDEVPEVEDVLRPPPPSPSTVATMLFWGIVVAGFTAGSALSLGIWWRLPFAAPKDLIMHGLIALICGVVVLVAARMWWRALSRREGGEARWVALAAPFFIVVGAAGGVAVARTVEVSPSSAALGYCYDVVTDVDGKRYDACTEAAERCSRELLGTRDYEGLVACLNQSVAAAR